MTNVHDMRIEFAAPATSRGEQIGIGAHSRAVNDAAKFAGLLR